LAIWDSEKESDFKKHRELVYAKADVVIIVYAIDKQHSFKNVTKKWKAQLKKHSKNSYKLILVGKNIYYVALKFEKIHSKICLINLNDYFKKAIEQTLGLKLSLRQIIKKTMMMTTTMTMMTKTNS
jgi:GTPase SAR1 family protein